MVGRTTLFGALAVVAIAIPASSSSAADMVGMNSHDWTGPYAGLQLGIGWGNTEPSYGTGFGPLERGNIDLQGLIGGVEAGYQYQTGSLVLGIESDVSLSGVDGYFVSPTANTRPCIIIGQGCDAGFNWLATARARAGFAIDNFMPFVTGGLAIGGVDGTFDSPNNACTCHVDDVSLGFVFGGGVEWAIDEKWSAKAEYLYVNLGKPDIDGDNTLATPGVATDNYNFNVVRLGLNYAF